jgi:exosome complex RNA-binding protein Rrp42 (RNase PH superfamily)
MVYLSSGQDFVREFRRSFLLTLRDSVLAQVTATIVKPREDRPYEGFLLINSEISPMASTVYEPGR